MHTLMLIRHSGLNQQVETLSCIHYFQWIMNFVIKPFRLVTSLHNMIIIITANAYNKSHPYILAICSIPFSIKIVASNLFHTSDKCNYINTLTSMCIYHHRYCSSKQKWGYSNKFPCRSWANAEHQFVKKYGIQKTSMICSSGIIWYDHSRLNIPTLTTNIAAQQESSIELLPSFKKLIWI